MEDNAQQQNNLMKLFKGARENTMTFNEEQSFGQAQQPTLGTNTASDRLAVSKIQEQVYIGQSVLEILVNEDATFKPHNDKLITKCRQLKRLYTVNNQIQRSNHDNHIVKMISYITH